MDVTPHDLRNAELRDAFRGYRPDDVEELLERAAVTLEHAHERNRLLTERLEARDGESSSTREIEGVMRQTLLLAQRAADEAVANARAQADALTAEAERKAATLSREVEEQARLVGEAQRQKYEAIVAVLSAQREALVTELDGLERVQAEYRGRLRAVLERELAELDRKTLLPAPDRPEPAVAAAAAMDDTGPLVIGDPETGPERSPFAPPSTGAAGPAAGAYGEDDIGELIVLDHDGAVDDSASLSTGDPVAH